MKKFLSWTTKIMPAFVACLTLVLTVSANSSSCYLINQPEEPKSISKFKKFQ